MGKVTAQLAPSSKVSFLFNRNLKYRFHRRDAPYLFVEDKATVLQDQPAQNYVAQLQSGARPEASSLTPVSAGCGARSRPGIRARCSPPTSPCAIRYAIRRINAAELQSLNPNHRYQTNATVSYFADTLGAGTHDFKAGTQLSWERMGYERVRNGDISARARGRRRHARVPVEHPDQFRPSSSRRGRVFAQDRWMIGRATINAGFRIDGVKAYVPAQSSPAGTWVGERSLPASVRCSISRRTWRRGSGMTYDLAGNGRTAIKAYYGRFYNQFGSELARIVQPERVRTAASAVERSEQQPASRPR